MKTVVKKYSNGQEKVIELGKKTTCVLSEPWGWGTSCKTILLKSDGLYHCNDCGLVFKKPVLKEDQRAVLVECDCKRLVNFTEWYFNECYGYNCPTTLYRCERCKRIYKGPYFTYAAPLKFQESEAARKDVQWYHEYMRTEQQKKIGRAREDAEKIKKTLKQLPKKERQKILNQLRS